MRMRSGLAFPAVDGEGRSRVIFENSFVYYDGEDAFATAQRRSSPGRGRSTATSTPA
jgi:hypothetical protein